MRWDAELLPGGSEGLLEGMGRRIDMRERSEVVLLRGEYTVTLAMPGLMDVQYALEPGWNLLSCNLLLEKAYHLLLMDMGAICYDRETRCYVRRMENTQENCFWLFAREASGFLHVKPLCSRCKAGHFLMCSMTCRGGAWFQLKKQPLCPRSGLPGSTLKANIAQPASFSQEKLIGSICRSMEVTFSSAWSGAWNLRSCRVWRLAAGSCEEGWWLQDSREGRG